MDNKLKSTIEKIKLLSNQNEEFKQEMRKLFSETVPASTDSIHSLSDDITAIRSALEIRANVSISYDFVKEQRLRDQLIIDNLRMENAALNLKESEEDRFYVFCVNAFYQVENIINYYYHVSFPQINQLLKEIEDATQSEKNDDFKFKSSGKEQNVGSIPIVHKINALCNTLLNGENSLKWAIGTLRQVRNEGEHRCSIIRKEQDEKNNLYKFFKNNTFNSIRIYLKHLISAIKNAIENPTNIEFVEVTIVNMLPSACYISLKGTNVELPNKYFSRVKGLKNGDSIRLSILGKRIMDVLI